MSSLYRGVTVVGQPAVLHASATVSDPYLGVVAIIGAKQPILPYVALTALLIIIIIIIIEFL